MVYLVRHNSISQPHVYRSKAVGYVDDELPGPSMDPVEPGNGGRV